MDRDRLVYRIAFSQLKGINQMLASEILSRIGSEEEFFKELKGFLGDDDE